MDADARLVYSCEDVACQMREHLGFREIDRVPFDDPWLVLRMWRMSNRVRRGTLAPTALLIMPTELVLRKPWPSVLSEVQELAEVLDKAFHEVPTADRHTVAVESGGLRMIIAVERYVMDETIRFARAYGFSPLAVAAHLPDGDVVILPLDARPKPVAIVTVPERRVDTVAPPRDPSTMPTALRRELLRRRLVKLQKSKSMPWRIKAAVSNVRGRGVTPKFHAQTRQAHNCKPAGRGVVAGLLASGEIIQTMPRTRIKGRGILLDRVIWLRPGLPPLFKVQLASAYAKLRPNMRVKTLFTLNHLQLTLLQWFRSLTEASLNTLQGQVRAVASQWRAQSLHQVADSHLRMRVSGMALRGRVTSTWKALIVGHRRLLHSGCALVGHSGIVVQRRLGGVKAWGIAVIRQCRLHLSYQLGLLTPQSQAHARGGCALGSRLSDISMPRAALSHFGASFEKSARRFVRRSRRQIVGTAGALAAIPAQLFASVRSSLSLAAPHQYAAHFGRNLQHKVSLAPLRLTLAVIVVAASLIEPPIWQFPPSGPQEVAQAIAQANTSSPAPTAVARIQSASQLWHTAEAELAFAIDTPPQVPPNFSEADPLTLNVVAADSLLPVLDALLPLADPSSVADIPDARQARQSPEAIIAAEVLAAVFGPTPSNQMPTVSELPMSLRMVSKSTERVMPTLAEPRAVSGLPSSVRPMARPVNLRRVTLSRKTREGMLDATPPAMVMIGSGGVDGLRVLAISGSDRGRQALVQTEPGRTQILYAGSPTALGKVIRIERNGVVLRGNQGVILLQVGN